MPRLSVVDSKRDNAEERLKERLAAEENCIPVAFPHLRQRR